MTQFTPAQIEEQASQLLKKYPGLEFPVNVIHIANNLGYECKIFHGDAKMKNISGVVDYDNKQININDSESPCRKRFTIAHEIGHIILHPGENRIDFRTQPSDRPFDVKEFEANEFAGCLLMPRDIFSQKYLHSSFLKEVCDFFGVSEQALLVRADRLGLAKNG